MVTYEKIVTQANVYRLQYVLGRTFLMAGVRVQVVSYDARSVTFHAVDADRTLNGTCSIQEFFNLDLQEV